MRPCTFRRQILLTTWIALCRGFPECRRYGTSSRDPDFAECQRGDDCVSIWTGLCVDAGTCFCSRLCNTTDYKRIQYSLGRRPMEPGVRVSSGRGLKMEHQTVLYICD